MAGRVHAHEDRCIDRRVMRIEGSGRSRKRTRALGTARLAPEAARHHRSVGYALGMRRTPAVEASPDASPHHAPRHARLAHVAALVSLVVVAASDSVTPLGFAHGILYLPSVLLAGASEHRRTIWTVTAAAVVLTILGAFTSPPAPAGIAQLDVAANRLVAIAALLGTALLAEVLLRAVERERRALADAARAEAQLTRSNELLEVAGDTMRLGGWSVDLRSGEIRWSHVVARLHGKPPGFSPTLDEGIGFYHPDDQPRVRAAVERCITTGTPFDFVARLVQSDGSVTWVRSIGRAVRDTSGAVIGFEGSFQDVTAERELEQRSDELATTLEQISDAFFMVGPDWRFRYVNPQALRVMRRERGSLDGRVIWDEFPEAVGSVFDTTYREAVATQSPRHFEAYFEPLDLWVEVRAHPLRDGLAVYFQDIGERKRAEGRLQASQRLESIGQLTGGVAHDFNNLLTVVGGNAELLHDRLADDPQGARLAAMIVEAAERGASLTRSLLAFARKQPLEPRPTDAHALVCGLEPLLRRSVGEAIELRIEPPATQWSTDVDPTHLESAVLNLALNARDAMPQGGRLTIEVEGVALEAHDPRAQVEAPAGDYVVLSVSDTGVGIDPVDLPRVFEPFFTTKGQGEGTGMGLAMVYGFAKQSGGFATIYSELGQGTTVRVYLPRDLEGRTYVPRVETAAELTGGSERILVVEDDERVRAFAVEQLRALGYDVLEAADAHAALTLLEREGVDLLFTDVVMPGGMSGKALADAATAADPALRVLFTSGYTENAIVHHGRLDVGVALLNKPYRRGELAQRVRQVLDGRASGRSTPDA